MTREPSGPSQPHAAGHHGPLLIPNRLSFLGMLVSLVSFVTVVVLIAADFLWFREQVYSSIITYLVVPGFLIGGLCLTVLGYVLAWWRDRHGYREIGRYPVIDLNSPERRRGIAVVIGIAALFVALSSVGGYKAYHLTESVAFCGQACHGVMEPEHTAYLGSPHARVKCVECHIGSGANWYVKSKMSGLRQVYAYAFNTYKLPVQVPIHNLRPAQETCEQCHWPEKFSGSVVRVFWHHAQDEGNTPRAFHLLMKIGGGSSRTGTVEGIHWHVSRAHKVEYWAADRQRLDIPWVRVTHADGEQVVYARDGAETPPEDQLRVMDCIDCHNRPAHVYRSPERTINEAFAHGRLDRTMPNLLEHSLELFDKEYPTAAAARAAFDQHLRETYGDRIPEASVTAAVAALGDIYAGNIFPQQGVDWRTYPSHIEHYRFPGCFRCHDGQHVSPEGVAIRNNCNLCHDIIAQPVGDACFAEQQYQVQPFEHPGGEGWEEMACTDCHAAPPPSTPLRNPRTAKAE